MIKLSENSNLGFAHGRQSFGPSGGRNKCWLCVRVTPHDIFSAAHKIWSEDRTLAHKLAAKLVEEIKFIYSANPTSLSGISRNAIIGGGLYIFGIVNGSPKKQFKISNALDCTEYTIRNGYKLMLKLMSPEIVSEFNKKDAEFTARNLWHRRGKGKNTYGSRDENLRVGSW